MAKERERPLSPHLQVYKPQLTSALSIFHRMTGVVLSGGTVLLAWWLVSAAAGPSWYACVAWFFSSWAGYAVLGVFSLCLMYHLCNGIRHLFWDAGMGFEIREAYSSGYAVLAATVILTALAWIAGLSMGA